MGDSRPDSQETPAAAHAQFEVCGSVCATTAGVQQIQHPASLGDFSTAHSRIQMSTKRIGVIAHQRTIPEFSGMNN